MTHLSLIARLLLVLVPALSVGAFGCVAEVASGGDEGGGGEGGGDEGDECTSYKGDGCTPGDVVSCGDPDGNAQGFIECQLFEYCVTKWSAPGCNTPLVLSFDQGPVEYTIDAMHSFNLQSRASELTDWPTARTPWLAMDRDGSGAIEDGSELFGSMSPLSSGLSAPNGFVALRELDENHDGRIDALDPQFSRLLVWADQDGDRRSQAGELRGVAGMEIESIELDYWSVPSCDARGNCEVERAPFVYRDVTGARRTGMVIDVRLPAQR